jgi:hypothetical protein
MVHHFYSLGPSGFSLAGNRLDTFPALAPIFTVVLGVKFQFFSYLIELVVKPGTKSIS